MSGLTRAPQAATAAGLFAPLPAYGASSSASPRPDRRTGVPTSS
ncbi:hypothetical protein ABZX82_32400 [Streptomyces griseoflavus]